VYDALFEEKREVCTELEMFTRLSSQQKEKDVRQTDKIKQLLRELDSKEEIVSQLTIT
jgi:acetyl-CoA carboxylase beta subunit